MKHLILGTLVRSRWRLAASLAIVGIFLVGLWSLARMAGLWLIPIGVAIPVLVASWPRSRIFSDARRFPERRSKRVILRYEPGVERTLNLEKQVNQWEQALDELERKFGFHLKRRPLVFVYATPAKARQLAGTTWAGAVALMGKDVVVASVASLRHHPMETMRHELAHLFSATWLRLPSVFPFRDEGVATWLQGTVADTPVDRWAQSIVRRGRRRPLSELFQLTRYPEAASDAVILYVLAGSFTGYLIRTFGWNTYRKFFGTVQAGNFAQVFRRVFGVEFQKAEDHWLAKTLECSPVDMRISHRLQKSYDSLLRTVERLSSRTVTAKTIIDMPKRLAERRRQLYG